jgi:predicted TIM-barrel fold metal-dependent hydrolase
MVELSSTSPPLIVDIHTHLYPPSYIDLLSSRKKVPYIHKPPDGSEPRLIILPSDDDASKPPESRGRPIDSSYSSLDVKRAFMTQHNITISVISLANPWLDFLEPSIAPEIARTINDDLEISCANFNKSSFSTSNTAHKLYAFGTLPLSAPPAQVTAEISRIKSLPRIKGVIMGTTGLGAGLDDPGLDPIYSALESTSTLIFLHPHYGLPATSFGGDATLSRTGHVLPLALGFPLETTIAITRAFLSGIFDKFPNLQILLAHSGGTLPFLAGRIQSCVAHEREFTANGGDKPGPERDIWDVLKTNIYLDAVIYGEPGLKAAVDASSHDRVMFGTDHPFFPPLKDRGGRWESVDTNLKAIEGAIWSERVTRGILGGNAIRVLGLEV